MKNLAEFVAARRLHDSEQVDLPDSGLCISCSLELRDSRVFQEFRVCDRCRFHYSLGAHRRIELLVDAGSFDESNRSLISLDPLAFRARGQYRDRVVAEQRRTGLADAIVTGSATVAGRKVVVSAIDFRFLGGSIGCAVGEKLARALEQGARGHLPVITIIASGGVRMQEGLLALLQFAKVVQAAQKLTAAGELHLTVLANPCLGGAYAVLANLGDLIVAEPGALIGYASTRAVEANQAAGRPVNARARSAEALRDSGLIDQVIDRTRLRDFASSALEVLAARPRGSAAELEASPAYAPAPSSAWTSVQLARHAERPTAKDFIGRFSDTFIELRGDRTGIDDPAVVCGIGMLGGEAVLYAGFERTHGAATHTIQPAGFRKAARAFGCAAKLRLPIVTLIDGAVAAPQTDMEEAGLGAALAGAMTALSASRTPVVGAVIGEARGESALALAIADRLLMLQNSAFEVVSPEQAASILFRDSALAEDVATALKPTANDALKLGVIDAVVPEPSAGAHSDHEAAARLLSTALLRSLAELRGTPPARLARARQDRYRRVGQYTNYLSATVGQDVAHLSGDLARRAGGALARITRRRKRGPSNQATTLDDNGRTLFGGESISVP